MSVSERNRNEVYDSIKPTLTARQQEVLDVIGRYPKGLARHEIAELMRRPTHAISGRVTELIGAKVIEETGEKRKTPSGSPATVVRVKRQPTDKVEQQYFW